MNIEKLRCIMQKQCTFSQDRSRSLWHINGVLQGHGKIICRFSGYPFFFPLSQNLWKRGKMSNILFASVTFGDFKKFLKETIVDIISVYCLFCDVKLIITKKKWNSYHYENNHKYGLSFTFWPGARTFLYDIWCLTWCNIPQECCNIWIHWNLYTL